ncbi:MAG TPA: hypothetical protein VG870_01920 [Chitinophagaceae bacterium]|nr:hypothetical protein [Chitinophagaceae bacterium]
MRKIFPGILRVICLLPAWGLPAGLRAQGPSVSVHADWEKTLAVCHTVPTLQVVDNPRLSHPSLLRERCFQALKDLGASYVRYVPWFPYPQRAVAELRAPERGHTYWDFSRMDSSFIRFMEATRGQPVVINFSTVPAWMWQTDSLPAYPGDPDLPDFGYNRGTRLRDTTLQEVAGYFARVFRWYTQGGFTDERGDYHASGYHYFIPYWEVLNEPDMEHGLTPQEYTRIYDAVVDSLRKISPATRFVGMSLSRLTVADWFEYFLDSSHHQPGMPLDAISYHMYATPWAGQSLDELAYTFFDRATGFVHLSYYIDRIRRRLSPRSVTMANEIGTLLDVPYTGPVPAAYWNLSAAVYAYLYLELAKIGVEVAGQSQLLGFPSMFPEVTLMDWRSARPNARYWVLKMLHDQFHPGDSLMVTHQTGYSPALTSPLVAQGWKTRQGRRILLINTKTSPLRVHLDPEARHARFGLVEAGRVSGPPIRGRLAGSFLTLGPFAVCIVELGP